MVAISRTGGDAPTWRNRFARRSLHFKRWLLARSPALIWGLRGHPEPEIALVRALCPRDALFVDAGASFGMWTYHARKHVARVVAFEPLPPLAAALARGFGKRVQVHEVALSSTCARATITMPQLQWGYSTIDSHNDLRGKVSEAFEHDRFEVETRTLDSYDLRGVGFLKIDTEGHEASVLAGARETLRREQPIVVVETEERHHHGSVAAVTDELAALGYRRHFLFHGELRDDFSVERHQDVSRPADYVKNLIFMPAR